MATKGKNHDFGILDRNQCYIMKGTRLAVFILQDTKLVQQNSSPHKTPAFHPIRVIFDAIVIEPQK
jgi:hypothetical protein